MLVPFFKSAVHPFRSSFPLCSSLLSYLCCTSSSPSFRILPSRYRAYSLISNRQTKAREGSHALVHPTIPKFYDEVAMDTIAPVFITASQVDAVKEQTPEVKLSHVENAELHPFLPRGIHETEVEQAAHWFIGSIDCGTTSSRFLIFDGEGNPVAGHQIEFENKYPESG